MCENAQERGIDKGLPHRQSVMLWILGGCIATNTLTHTRAWKRITKQRDIHHSYLLVRLWLLFIETKKPGLLRKKNYEKENPRPSSCWQKDLSHENHEFRAKSVAPNCLNCALFLNASRVWLKYCKTAAMYVFLVLLVEFYAVCVQIIQMSTVFFKGIKAIRGEMGKFTQNFICDSNKCSSYLLISNQYLALKCRILTENKNK